MSPTRRFASALLLCILVSACSRSYNISVDPSDARVSVNGAPVTPNTEHASAARTLAIEAQREGYEPYRQSVSLGLGLGTRKIEVRLARRQLSFTVGLVEGSAAYSIDGTQTGTLPFSGTLEYGRHVLELADPAGHLTTVPFEVRDNGSLLLRPQAAPLPVVPQGILVCGVQPKQVNFSPDGRYFYVTLLNGEGFQIFDMEQRKLVETVRAGTWPRSRGFVEGLFVPGHGTYLVSQMFTNHIFEYQLGTGGVVTYARGISSGGNFPKFIAYSRQLDALAVSNWLSSDVAIIDYATGSRTHLLSRLLTPRGLAFSPDGAYLYVASYDGGDLIQFRTDTWAEERRFHVPSSMRHIVITADGRCFVSDMLNGLVFELNAGDLSLIHTYTTFPNPNTIDLTSDGRFLFVSCRGPNNPQNYELRSPENGRVMIFDTRSKARVAVIGGGNQPTGLDVSPDNRYLVFTNFQDANLEIYDIAGLYETQQNTGRGARE